MPLWECARWGIFGALAIEGADTFGVIRRTGKLPWTAKQGPTAKVYSFSVAIRLGLGAVLAVVLGASNQLTGPLAAFTVGLAAPVFIERIFQRFNPSDNSFEDGGATNE